MPWENGFGGGGPGMSDLCAWFRIYREDKGRRKYRYGWWKKDGAELFRQIDIQRLTFPQKRGSKQGIQIWRRKGTHLFDSGYIEEQQLLCYASQLHFAPRFTEKDDITTMMTAISIWKIERSKEGTTDELSHIFQPKIKTEKDIPACDTLKVHQQAKSRQ